MNAQDRNQFSGRISAAVLVSMLLLASLAMPCTAFAAGLAPGDIVISANVGVDAGLVVVDPTTGNRTILSDGTHGTGPGFVFPEGVTEMSNGDLLVADVTAGIFEVDPLTGNRTILANNSGIGTGPTIGPIVARQFGNQILATMFPSDDPKGIMTIDPLTGNRSWFSAQGARGSGLPFMEPLGFVIKGTTLFVADNQYGNIFEVDTATGNRVQLAGITPPFLFFPFLVDVALDKAGNLVLSTRDGSGTVNSLDLTTMTPQLISGHGQGSGPSFVSPGGIGTASDGTILLADSGLNAVLQIDPLTGNRTILSDATHGTGPSFSNPQFLLVVPNVPEPSTIVLAALGVLALLAYRWRMA